jgi:hypothetical protein
MNWRETLLEKLEIRDQRENVDNNFFDACM